MDNTILTNSVNDGGIVTLKSYKTKADQFFDFTQPIINNINVTPAEDIENKDVDEEIENLILEETEKNKKQVEEIRKQNPNTKLTDEQINDLYNSFNSGGFVIF